MALTDTKLVEMAASIPERGAEGPAASSPRALNRAVLIQFLQFCLVGALSTALNVALLNLFLSHGLGIILAHIFAFSLAVTNGFFLNRVWTFRHSRAGRVEHQYLMFVLINLVGLGLSLGITLTVGVVLLNSSHLAPLMGMYRALTGHLAVPKQLVYSLGEVAATPICAVWNFSANKLWTFRGHHS